MTRFQLALFMLVVSLAVSAYEPAPGAAMANPEVALAPFVVVKDTGGALRTVADACLERLATGLTAGGIAIVRHPALDEKTLSTARPARWAVLGEFRREGDKIRAELRLMEVATGDELRSYANITADTKLLVDLGRAAAERIVGVVKEKR